MKNKLGDLNNYLFEQIERLLDDEVCHDTDSTELEIKKAGAITNLSNSVVNVGQLQLSALKITENTGLSPKDLPETLSITKK